MIIKSDLGPYRVCEFILDRLSLTTGWLTDSRLSNDSFAHASVGKGNKSYWLFVRMGRAHVRLALYRKVVLEDLR